MPKKFIKSFKFARAGAEHAWKTQRNLWIHFVFALAVLALAIRLKVSLLELSVLVMAISGVIVAEMINTAFEELVNILSPQQRLEAALVKNVAAAAVLLAAAGAVIVGCIVFVPRLI